MKTTGVIAAGHPKTVEAARIMLEQGGNAFDAVLAAHLAACVVEPVFTSLGGGGFLLAHAADGRERLYDFFAHTPLRPRPAEGLDFYPIRADFGTVTQEFHIGLGSVATPGMVKGIFRIHRELCTLPMVHIAAPAVELARKGVRVNRLQSYALQVVALIYRAVLPIYGSHREHATLVGQGEMLRLPQLADTLETLAREGERWFYRGEPAQAIARACRDGGGQITAEDLAGYRVAVRKPLAFTYHGARLLTNPPPSSGGTLIAFALKLLEPAPLSRFGSEAHLRLLALAMSLTQRARAETERLPDLAAARKLLDARTLRAYLAVMRTHPLAAAGTTHVSIIDGQGNLASMTCSNGEGSGHMVPGTGIMLNNMLGEEDLNPRGFHHWPAGRRLSSMMAPTLVFSRDGWSCATGSGGSNRIRTAILQVLVNLLDFGMPLARATLAPRIHLEGGLLSAEGGFDAGVLQRFAGEVDRVQLWQERNLFFGGVHSALHDPRDGSFSGAGDPRRGGRAAVLS